MAFHLLVSKFAISIQNIVGVGALVGGIYAGYDLVFGNLGRRPTVPGVLARSWICILLTTIGVDQVIFGQNAVLQFGYVLGLPLLAVQIGLILSLVIAGLAWSGG